MRHSMRIVVLVIMMFCAVGSVFALSGQPKEEFDQFIRNLREEKRIDQLGYLIQINLPSSRSNDDRVLSLVGKYFYASQDGYLSHVNYVRLEKLRKAKIEVKILDKKRLDDQAESWYMVWVDSMEQGKAIREKFEPLFFHDKTMVIRIRPEHVDTLIALKAWFSQIEEALLPPKRLLKVVRPVAVTVDPFIQNLLPLVTKENLVATVQYLQDLKSRSVRYIPGNTSATTWLADQFRKLPDLTVETPLFTSNYGKFMNVVATKKGFKEPNTVLVVCGHFDSTVSSGNSNFAPGADDNGTGAAGVLEIARMVAGLKLPYTVMFAFMNAEEVGLIGSKAMAKTLAGTTGIQIKAVLNMDMLADKEDNEVAVIGNTNSNWLIDVFKDVAQAYVGLKSNTLYNSNIWQSDHSSFWNIGASAILTIEGYPDYSAYYHSIKDLVANFAPTMMEKIVRANLATLLTLNPPIVEQARRK